MLKAAFLDRDGVINRDEGYTHRIEQFELIEGVPEALIKLQQAGFLLIIVTNQSGIGRGFYSEEDYQQLTAWYRNKLEKMGITVTDILHCPHHPDDRCECRKPLPGLFLQAIKSHDIDFSSSIMIGDKDSDIKAAESAGVARPFLIHPNTDNALLQCVLDNIVIVNK